jgi:hypothetical protein
MRALLTSNLQLRNFNEFSSITEGGYNSRLLALLAHSSGIIPIFQSRGPCERSPGTGGTRCCVISTENWLGCSVM